MDSATSTIATTSPGTTPFPPDYVTPLFREIGAFLAGTEGGGIVGFLETTWSIYTIVAYLASLFFLYVFIYASMRLSALRAAVQASVEAERQAYLSLYGTNIKQSQWHDLQVYLDSINPNDWKLAIIEADILLDDTLRQMGFTGASLGERLKNISPHSLRTIEEAWTAHKVRNQVAHGGADFVLTHKLARDTISHYRKVFEELGIV